MSQPIESPYKAQISAVYFPPPEGKKKSWARLNKVVIAVRATLGAWVWLIWENNQYDIVKLNDTKRDFFGFKTNRHTVKIFPTSTGQKSRRVRVTEIDIYLEIISALPVLHCAPLQSCIPSLRPLSGYTAGTRRHTNKRTSKEKKGCFFCGNGTGSRCGQSLPQSTT